MEFRFNILTLLLALFSIVACSPDKELDEASAITTDYVDVQIVLSTGNGGGRATRAADNPAYGNNLAGMVTMENGKSYDNYIDPDDVVILVFEKEDTDGDGIYDDGQFIEQAVVTGVVNKKEDGSYTEDDLYETHAILTQIPLRFKNENNTYNYTRNTEFQIVALCNQGINGNSVIKSNFNDLELTGKTLGWFIDNLTYSGYIPNFTRMLINGKDNQKARIPMWGTVPTRIIPNEGQTTITGVVIPILRAMAQVRIKLDSNLHEDYTLNGVKLYNYNTTGTMATTGNADGTEGHNQAIRSTEYTVTYEDNTTQTTIPANSTNFNSTDHTGIVYPSIYGSETQSALDFQYLSDTEEYVIYIPEYRNMAQGNNAAQTAAYIDLDVRNENNNAVPVNNILYFADYTDSSSSSLNANEWDILRNDIYDYTITSITPNGGLNAKVRVNPWKYETMDYELSQNQSVVVMWSSHKPYKYDDYGNYALPVAHEDEINMGFVRVQISMPQPKGVKWMAHLTNTRDFKFVYEYTPNDGGNKEIYSDYGFGAGVSLGTNPTDEDYAAFYSGLSSSQVTVAIAPVNPYEINTNKRTELYFTIETLTEGYAQIDSNGQVDEIVNTIPDRICIVQTAKENIERNY